MMPEYWVVFVTLPHADADVGHVLQMLRRAGIPVLEVARCDGDEPGTHTFTVQSTMGVRLVLCGEGYAVHEMRELARDRAPSRCVLWPRPAVELA